MAKDKLKIGVSDDVLVKTHSSIGLSTPKKYNVVFYNDDYTPVDFVVQLLVDIFHHSIDSAQEMSATIHTEGKGVAGTYNFEIAEQKAYETAEEAQQNQYPLKVTIEEIQ